MLKCQQLEDNKSNKIESKRLKCQRLDKDKNEEENGLDKDKNEIKDIKHVFSSLISLFFF